MYATLLTVVLTAVGLSQASPFNVLSPRAATAQCPQLKTAPAGSICGKAGHLTTPHPSGSNGDDVSLQYPACQTKTQCAEKCKGVGYSNCESFSFDTASKTCTFYSSTISQQGFKARKASTTTFYDATCFKCTGCAPNLINGNFESGSLSPWFDNTQALNSQNTIGPGYNSKYALSLTPATTGSPDLYSYAGEAQFFYQCPNTTYNIDFEYMFPTETTGSGDALFLYIAQANSNSGPLFSAGPNDQPMGTWYHGSASYTSGSTKSGEILFSVESNNINVTCLIDNVVVSLA